MRSTVYLMLSFAALCSEVSPLMAQNPVSNRVVAPRDGFYRVERAADCVANSRYIFASSSFATIDYVLAAPSNSKHTSSSGNNMMAQVPIINGSFIAPPSNNVVWEYDSSKRTLRNVQSNEVLTTTGDNYLLQTISGSVPSNVYGSLHFLDGDPAFANGRLFPSDEYPLRFILERTKKGDRKNALSNGRMRRRRLRAMVPLRLVKSLMKELGILSTLFVFFAISLKEKLCPPTMSKRSE